MAHEEVRQVSDQRGRSSLRVIVTILAIGIVVSAIGVTTWMVSRPDEGRAARAGASGPHSSRAIDCNAAPYGNSITGTVEGDVEITEHGTVCEIRGTVRGSVTVRDDGTSCDEDDMITAADIRRGTIEGDIVAVGGACVMVFLEDGARVAGNVVYRANGNLGFLGDAGGAWVGGSLLLRGGRLWAHGTSTTNRIDGDLVCEGGMPKQGLRSGSETNWDGWHDDVDGELGGSYTAC